MRFVPIDNTRYEELMREYNVLTLEESKSGWHFCKEFDGLLINPTSPEWQCCACRSKIKFLENVLLTLILKDHEVFGHWLKIETDERQNFILRAKTHEDDEEKF